MSKVIQSWYRCFKCGKKYSETEYDNLPRDNKEGVRWPTCPCGNWELISESNEDKDD